MNYNKKPLINESDKQLFSYDVCRTGAKNFTFDSYKNIYQRILDTYNGYEDNTYSNINKLFVDVAVSTYFFVTKLFEVAELDKSVVVDGKAVKLTFPVITWFDPVEP